MIRHLKQRHTGFGHNGWVLGTLLWLLFVFAAFGGWVMNIVKIVEGFDIALTGLMVVRIIGVFVFPLGCVLGWI